MPERASSPVVTQPIFEAAQSWVDRFVTWCNDEHGHGALNWVTPSARQAGEDIVLLRRCRETYERARSRRSSTQRTQELLRALARLEATASLMHTQTHHLLWDWWKVRRVNKSPRISSLLARLELPRRGWEILDHWDADLEAIGITDGNRDRLVYVSVFDKAEGRFDFECERATGPNAENYEVVGSGEDASFDELVGAMEAHLKERLETVGYKGPYGLEMGPGSPISITVASPPDRNDLVAELWLGKDLIGDVARDAEIGFRLELYPAPGKAPRSVPVADLIAALEQATKRLGTD